MASVKISEIIDGTHFFIQNVADRTVATIEEKMKELFMMPKISEEDLKLQAEEDAQKYEYLDSNLDDLFAKINRLAEEVMVEPKFEHKESLQVEPVSV